MAKRTANQGTGDIGEISLQLLFNLCGYACSDIDPDYGEDFFVFSQAGEHIEPFKIYVQSKASDTFDSVTSDWTEYVDPMTVRNWVLSNELTVVIRQNLATGEARYCIPEEEIDYFKINYGKNTPVRLLTQFSADTVEHLVWRARIRHYHRLVQMTRPSEFDEGNSEGVPPQRRYIVEFLVRIGVLQDSLYMGDRELGLYNALLSGTALTIDFDTDPELSIHEKLRYSACLQLIIQKLEEVSGRNQGITPQFADDCAALLIQFVIEEENSGRVIRPRSDEGWKAIRINFLRAFIGNRDATPVLTEWYPGHVKPDHSGTYQRDDGTLFFSLWREGEWHSRFDSFDDPPAVFTVDQSQDLPWRGVSPMSGALGKLISEFFLTMADSALNEVDLDAK